MNGDEIISLIARDGVLKQKFHGVFAANELPNYIPVGKGLIVNCCKRSLPGKHWLAIYKSSCRQIEFFDSFGGKPGDYGLNIKTDLLVRSNNIQLQNFFSDVCGLYCIFYLSKRVRGNGMTSIFNMFSHSNTLFNDSLLKKKMYSHFNHL